MFSMSCTNKGCYQQMEPFLDPNTNKVYCSICEAELTNVTNFTKQQLKSNKQFRKKATVAFGVKCNSCGKEDRPIIISNDIVCASCKKPLTHLSEPFKIILRDRLKSNE